jgi:hypothetical protein
MAEQIVLPFRSKRKSKPVNAGSGNKDLIGLSYFDRGTTVVVKACSQSNPALVVVERDSDGKSWTVPAGLIRLIIGNKRTLRRTA